MKKKDWDMYDYILESKAVVHHIVEQQDEIFQEALDYFFLQDIQQIYIVGSGTSYHASLASKQILEKVLGIRVFSYYPMAFKDGEQIMNKNSMVIGISHAGRSSSTIYALDKARAMGMHTIAACAERNRPLMEHADASMYIEIGPEYAGPKTKGFIGSIATLVVFGLNVALRQKKITQNEFNGYVERMLASVDQIPAIAQAASTWYEHNKVELRTCRRMIILGYENATAAMMEGTLKILEAVRYSVTGYELEEFMHGVYHSIHEDTFMIYLGSEGQYYERMIAMRNYFEKERQAHNFVITNDESLQHDQHNLVFPFQNDELFTTMEYVVPLQVIARKLSLDLGIDCNLSSDPDFHRKMGSYLY